MTIWNLPCKLGRNAEETVVDWKRGKFRRSTCVFYVQGDSDREGLVGYHTGADGTLEKVTAEQVYAWVNGVEIGGAIVKVQSGDRIWYETDADGWKVPLAVGGERPEGAEGYVVARDYAYADRLGVMEAGTYSAYALFDEGAGFAATSIAEAEVVVRGVDISGAKVELASASFAYDGRAKEPAVKSVTLGGKVLEAGGKKIAVDPKTGKVTLKKGLAKGTYKVDVKLTAPEGKNYKAASPKTITLTVKVK